MKLTPLAAALAFVATPALAQDLAPVVIERGPAQRPSKGVVLECNKEVYLFDCFEQARTLSLENNNMSVLVITEFPRGKAYSIVVGNFAVPLSEEDVIPPGGRKPAREPAPVPETEKVSSSSTPYFPEPA
jgi:hypothetical protein